MSNLPQVETELENLNAADGEANAELDTQPDANPDIEENTTANNGDTFRCCKQSQFETPESGCCTLPNSAFLASTINNMSWTDNVHRVSGGFLAIAHQMLLRCWISDTLSNTLLIDIAANFFASSAMFLLNTVNSKVVVSSKLHKTSMMFLFICFCFMFSPLVWAMWKLNKRDQDIPTCAATELVASMIVILVAMSVRFTELVFRKLWQPPNNQQNDSQCGLKFSIFLSISAALAIIAGVTLQAFCMLETESEENYCAIVPLSYLLPLPLLFITAAGVNSNPNNTTWKMWSKFVPAYTYTSTLIWPAVLYNTKFLTVQQLRLSLLSSVLLVCGARFLIGAMPMEGNYDHAATSQAGFYMF